MNMSLTVPDLSVLDFSLLKRAHGWIEVETDPSAHLAMRIQTKLILGHYMLLCLLVNPSLIIDDENGSRLKRR